MFSCCPEGSWGTPLDVPALKSANDKIVTIGVDDPLELYIARSNGCDKKAVLVFTDVYGFQNRLFTICEHIAKELNCYVVIMDNFRGETKDDHPDIWEWTSRHPYMIEDFEKASEGKAIGAKLHPVKNDIEATIQYLNEEYGIPRDEVSAIGFCWGVWSMTKACSAGVPFKCAVGFHPSLKFEELFGGNINDMVKEACKVPTLYCVAGNDPNYLKKGGDVSTLLEQTMQQEDEEKARPRCVDFPEMTHGWVSRGDTSVKKVKDDVEIALRLAADFLKHWMIL